MASDNTKYVARVPIVPDDLANTNEHVDHELVMDFPNDDLYVKYGNAYSNITGKIKERIIFAAIKKATVVKKILNFLCLSTFFPLITFTLEEPFKRSSSKIISFSLFLSFLTVFLIGFFSLPNFFFL